MKSDEEIRMRCLEVSVKALERAYMLQGKEKRDCMKSAIELTIRGAEDLQKYVKNGINPLTGEV